MPLSRSPLRLVRGALAATLASAVALGGHVLGGGDVPAAAGVLVPWWLSVTLCTLLAGSRFGLPRMAAAVVGSQLLFHALFVLGTGGTGAAFVDPPGSHLGHVATGSADHGAHLVEGAAGHSVHLLGAGLPMQIGHLVAALLTTMLLHRGETVLLHGASLVGRLWRARPGARRPAPAVPVVPTRPRPVLPALEHLGHAQRAVLSPHVLRGPPRGV